MKKLLLIVLYIVMVKGFTSCKKKDEPEKHHTTVQVTVKNASDQVVSNIIVYVFELPSIENNGKIPSLAIAAETTDENGVAEFNLNNLSVADQTTLHFTVLERLISGEYNVLGSTPIVITINTTIQEDLVITEPTLKYTNGYIPTTVSQDLAISEYLRWRAEEVVVCNGGLRVIADPENETRVEAIGFGMLLSAYAKDKATFDGIFNFYLSKRTSEANNMMAWLVTCDGVEDPGSATDGDIDVAFALIIASQQWGGTYLASAIEIINNIHTSLIQQCTVNSQTVNILAPGYSGGAWGGCNMTDIQYYTPAFFRVFAEVTGENIWNELADDSYILLNAAANETTGLVPDWQTAAGDPGPGMRVGYFGYDACRVPWRMALDYLWNGNTQAQAWCQKVSGWAGTQGPANIVDGYELDGTIRGTNHNSAFVGGFSVSAMCSSQALVNIFGTELSGINDTYWFNFNTRCLYLFTLTGNFWKPEIQK